MSCVVTADLDCLPANAVAVGQWESIDDDHRLIPMHDGRVLDWVPDSGHWRLWNYDPTHPGDCLPTEVSHGRWSTVGDGHVLVPMIDGKVIDWVPDSGPLAAMELRPVEQAGLCCPQRSHTGAGARSATGICWCP